MMPKGQMVLTPVAPGPFCQILSPGMKEADLLLQNWHLFGHASWHMRSSVEPGKGLGGRGDRALRAEAHTDSDFRRRRQPASGLETGTFGTSVR
jgi:hypothetical protein